MWFYMSDQLFITHFFNMHWSGVLTVLAWLVPHETTAVSAQVLCTPYNHAPCHFMQSHIRKVYACLAVTCHLHFWQNDWDLLCATVVTRGWNGYLNKSQHRKSTLEKKILPLLLQGFEPATFQSWVWRFNHWAIPGRVWAKQLSILPAALDQSENHLRVMSASLLERKGGGLDAWGRKQLAWCMWRKSWTLSGWILMAWMSWWAHLFRRWEQACRVPLLCKHASLSGKCDF